ncbi:hypothetical protein VM95_37935, partial [Streptomyces rubellomurinus]
CPPAQRNRCTTAATRPAPVTEEAITQHLATLGHPDLPHHWDPGTRTLTIPAPVDRRVCLNTAQRFQITVHGQRRDGDPYWTSRFNGSPTLTVPSMPANPT